jgi:hypothetical protein
MEFAKLGASGQLTHDGLFSPDNCCFFCWYVFTEMAGKATKKTERRKGEGSEIRDCENEVASDYWS